MTLTLGVESCPADPRSSSLFRFQFGDEEVARLAKRRRRLRFLYHVTPTPETL
jgi:hypothetical protein